MFVKIVSRIKKAELFRENQFKSHIQDLKDQIKAFQDKEKQFDDYRRMLFDGTGNKGEEWDEIAKLLKEYENLDELTEHEKLELLKKYSGVHEHLNMVRMSLIMYSGIDELKLANIDEEEFLNQIPEESLHVLIDKTSSLVQKKTALKMLEHFVKSADYKEKETQTEENVKEQEQIRQL